MAANNEFSRLLPEVVEEPERYLKNLEVKRAAGETLTEIEQELQVVAEVAIDAQEHYHKKLDIVSEGFKKMGGAIDELTQKISSGQPLLEEEGLWLDETKEGLERLLWWLNLSPAERDKELGISENT